MDSLLLKEAKAVIRKEELEKLIKQIEVSSNRKFTESEKKLFKFTFTHGFADGISYGKESLLDFLADG